MLDDLLEDLEDWFRDILTDFISGNLTSMFTDVNEKTGTIATEVGQTPQGWNSGVFNMVRDLSNNVIIPIAGLIIAFVLTYELISMLTERNNLHDVDTWMFFKWVFKSFIAVYLVTNTFNITMAIFDVGQHVVSGAAAVIGTDTAINTDQVVQQMQLEMMTMDVGELMQLALETMIVSLCMKIISIISSVTFISTICFTEAAASRKRSDRLNSIRRHMALRICFKDYQRNVRV